MRAFGIPRSVQRHFGKEPLYRKEFLWFIRDRSAIVQTILIPISPGRLPDIQSAGAACCSRRGLELSLRRRNSVRNLFSLGTWTKVPGFGGKRVVDFLDLAPGLGKSAESRSLAVVDDFQGWSRWCCATRAYWFPENIKEIVLVGIGWSYFSAGAWLKKR